LAFMHPVTGARIDAIAPPDSGFEKALALFQQGATHGTVAACWTSNPDS